MRKMHFGLAALFVSLAAVAVTACGDDSNPQAACTTNDDCKVGTFCNPKKVCADGCRSNTECTNGGTCDTATGTCSTPSSGCTKNEDCAAGQFCNAQKACVAGCRGNTDCTNGGTCNTATGVCSTPSNTCTKNEDCPTGQFCNGQKACVAGCRSSTECTNGQTCDTNTGTCFTPTCSPACTGNQVCDNHQGAGNPTCVDRCTWDSCDSSQNCNLQTGLCEIAQACDSSNPQPDVCLYGQYCSGTDFCDYVPKATCVNFTTGSSTPKWNPATSTGAIISGLTASYFGDDPSYCSSTEAFKLAKVNLEAYRTSGTFPATGSAFLDSLTYVLPDGTVASGSQKKLYSVNYNVSNNGKNVSVEIYFCLPFSTTDFSAGLFLDDGNEACVTRSGT